jgi:hypothetical protein
MTEDIIAMARRAGAHDDGFEVRFVELRYLERFAALVRADEREAFAKIQFESILQAIKIEREACARVCDRMAARCNDIRAAALESAAENIRLRGETNETD